MSELAKKARADMRAKAERMTGPSKGAIDASGWTEPVEAGSLGKKTGARPIGRQAYKKGGAVHGEEGRHHAGRKPRKAMGGPLDPDMYGSILTNRHAKGGKVHDDAAEDKKLIDRLVKPSARTDRKAGGWIKSAIKHPGALHKSLGVPKGEKIPAKKLAKAEHSDNPKLAKRARLAETLKRMHHASGGAASCVNEENGTRPTGGRIARKSGGKAGKGKMNVNIVIAQPRHDANQMPPQGMPPMPPKPAAVPVPPPMPQGMPPAPGGAPPMQMPPQSPMMGRKNGGRTYPKMKAGSMSGEGRLEKVKAYGLKPAV